MDFTCQVCYNEYNTTNHIPRVLPICGHTFCSKCIETFLNTQQVAYCPFDKLKFGPGYTTTESFPINFALRQIIDTRAGKEFFCSKHQQEMSLICVNDESIGCVECIHGPEQNHQNHKVLPLKNIIKQANDKMKGLTVALDGIESRYNNGSNFLKEKLTRLAQIVNSYFDKIIQELEVKRNSLLNEMTNFFDEEIKKFNDLLGSESLLRKRIAKIVSEQKVLFTKKEFFKIIKNDTSKVIEEINKLSLNQHTDQLKNRLDRLSGNLTSILSSKIQPLLQNEVSFVKIAEIIRILDLQTSEVNKTVLAFKLPQEQPHKLLITTKGSIHQDIPSVLIDNFSSIRELELIISNFHVSQADIQYLNEILVQLTNLTHIYIRGMDDINEDSLSNIGAMVFQRLKNITSVDFLLSRSHIRDETLNLLFNNLSEAKNLTSLTVDVSYTQVTDSTLQIIGQKVLSCLTNLIEFRLISFHTDMTDEGLAELFQKKCTLRKLFFDFYDTKVTAKGLAVLYQNIKSNSPNYCLKASTCLNCKTITSTLL